MAGAYLALRSAQDVAIADRAVELLGEDLVVRLRRVGLMEVGVMDSLADLPESELAVIFETASGGECSDLLDAWIELLKAAGAPAHRRRRVLAAAPPEFGATWPAVPGVLPAPTAARPPPVVVPLPPAGRPAKWPTRGRRAAALAVGAGDTQGAEESERRRWIGLAVDLLVEAGLPVAVFAARSLGGAGAASAAFGGRRLRTLRLRVRQMQRTLRWVASAGLGGFPRGESGVSALLAYVRDLVESDAARSAPSAALHALRFFEARGGVAEEEQVARHPLVLGAVAEAETRLAQDRTRHRRKAAQYSVEQVRAMERHVTSPVVPGYVRVFAWVRLVRVWTSTRSDDLVRVPPADVVLEGGDLVITLRRTKTTGPGKRREIVTAFVAESAWLFDPTWLSVGFALFRELASDHLRDYLLPLPTADLSGCRPAPAGYAHMLSMGRVLLRELVASDGSPLVDADAALLWTEHSPRMVMPSWGGAVGLPPDVLDRFGRWSEGGSRGYVRADRAIVTGAQGRVAEVIRSGAGPVFVRAENDLETRVFEFLVDRGARPEDARRKASRAVSGSPCSGSPESSLGVALVSAGPSVPPSFPPPAASSSGDESGEIASPVVSGGSDSEVSVAGRLPVGALVVSVTLRSGRRTLHRIPGCGRRPGVDYARYVLLDTDPSPEDYTHVCKRCWPPSRATPRTSIRSSLAPARSSSVSSSTSATSASSESSTSASAAM